MDKQMTFDEWHQNTDSLCPRRAFEAGRQSRQAEVDRLNHQINLLKHINDESAKNFQGMVSLVDEKDKRIEVALDLLEFPTASWEEVVFQAVEALRGERE